ncbi:peptidase C65 Otubain [Colletotrichum nymphaeae SA-01]|uniref:ubiquitinyl hydrolase 1 n=1 Tax=Colletotrichum nymphaeae SA-01 TaxID=1460502 RepID=A0A135SUP0_9PEZI|nr:peptidase C65 Otubain [Colletotrichum nymphaeae SA-01]
MFQPQPTPFAFHASAHNPYSHPHPHGHGQTYMQTQSGSPQDHRSQNSGGYGISTGAAGLGEMMMRNEEEGGGGGGARGRGVARVEMRMRMGMVGDGVGGGASHDVGIDTGMAGSHYGYLSSAREERGSGSGPISGSGSDSDAVSGSGTGSRSGGRGQGHGLGRGAVGAGMGAGAGAGAGVGSSSGASSVGLDSMGNPLVMGGGGGGDGGDGGGGGRLGLGMGMGQMGQMGMGMGMGNLNGMVQVPVPVPVQSQVAALAHHHHQQQLQQQQQQQSQSPSSASTPPPPSLLLPPTTTTTTSTTTTNANANVVSGVSAVASAATSAAHLHLNHHNSPGAASASSSSSSSSSSSASSSSSSSRSLSRSSHPHSHSHSHSSYGYSHANLYSNHNLLHGHVQQQRPPPPHPHPGASSSTTSSSAFYTTNSNANTGFTNTAAALAPDHAHAPAHVVSSTRRSSAMEPGDPSDVAAQEAAARDYQPQLEVSWLATPTPGDARLAPVTQHPKLRVLVLELALNPLTLIQTNLFEHLFIEANSLNSIFPPCRKRPIEPEFLLGLLVGDKITSDAITDEYAKADEIYIAKTICFCSFLSLQNLPQTYSHYRPVQGDGNCGWRAIGFSYFEHLINNGDHHQILGEAARITSLNQYLLNVGGYDRMLFEDMVEETIGLLKDVAQNIANPQLAMDIMVQRFNDQGSSNAIIYHLRLLALSWLKGNVELYEPFIPAETGIIGYCAEIERPNREIDHLGIILLVQVLLKPINFVLEIAYLDRSPGNQVNIYRFPDEANGQDPATLGPIIYLLYRPDHYDILYKSPPNPAPLNLQVHRVGSFSHSQEIASVGPPLHSYSLDYGPLAMLPGFGGPPSGLSSALSSLGSPTSTSPLPDAYDPSPQSPWLTTPYSDHHIQQQQQQQQQTAPAPRPQPQTPARPQQSTPAPTKPSQPVDYQLRFSHQCWHLNNTSSAQPSVIPGQAGFQEPSFTTAMFKNSHFNKAHYNNPHFHPEEWTPDDDGQHERLPAPKKKGRVRSDH